MAQFIEYRCQVSPLRLAGFGGQAGCGCQETGVLNLDPPAAGHLQFHTIPCQKCPAKGLGVIETESWGKWSKYPQGIGLYNRLATIFYIKLLVNVVQVSFDSFG